MRQLQPPPYAPIKPISLSSRWFPPGCTFGLYSLGGTKAPNVTSILSHFFPFDMQRWKELEPDIDHEAVSKESAIRGTAVHKQMEGWLSGAEVSVDCQYRPWVQPLQSLVSKATATLGVELPVFNEIKGAGMYAGSCDAVMMVKESVVLIDYKTKRHGKMVYSHHCKKQKLQLAAYAMAVNSSYRDQLPGSVQRVSLLFAHPEEGRMPTVISASATELQCLQEEWTELLAVWTRDNVNLLKAQTQ